jgi:hypothetical protein
MRLQRKFFQWSQYNWSILSTPSFSFTDRGIKIFYYLELLFLLNLLVILNSYNIILYRYLINYSWKWSWTTSIHFNLRLIFKRAFILPLITLKIILRCTFVRPFCWNPVLLQYSLIKIIINRFLRLVLTVVCDLKSFQNVIWSN